MHTTIKNVVIVGGGTAGWMTAAQLNRVLGQSVNVTLVESKAVGIVGVGEASFNTIKLFFDTVGLPEQDWMPKCKATYKMAIKFVNWSPVPGHFYHPFQRFESVDGFNLAEWWLKTRKGSEPFDYACFSVPELCDHKRSPKYFDDRLFYQREQYHPYAYHFDAGLLASCLRDISIQRGVTHVIGDVSNILLKNNGEIDYVTTLQGHIVHGDLFIDCSGFRGLLINQTLGEPFISFSKALFCDSAIAMRIPVDNGNDGINPYTTATALSSGWAWEIPLYGRVGCGYVYSGAFISQDRADMELRTHIGARSSDIESLHIRMRVGRNRSSWVKNCVSIGLSSGFVEPLESTGIFFIQYGIAELINHFPDGSFDEAVRRNYNEVIASCIDGVRDFLVLHYCLSMRSDTKFWQAVKHELAIPEDLRQKLVLWKNRLPNASNVNSAYHGFSPYSYSVLLLGLKYYPTVSLPILEYLDNTSADNTFLSLKLRTDELRKTLPGHYDFLRAFYARSPSVVRHAD
jgi:tryptophan 6-halogenase